MEPTSGFQPKSNFISRNLAWGYDYIDSVKNRFIGLFTAGVKDFVTSVKLREIQSFFMTIDTKKYSSILQKRNRFCDINNQLKSGIIPNKINTSSYLTFETNCLSIPVPTLNRTHTVTDHKMILTFLKETRGGELLNFGEDDEFKALGSHNMLLGQYKDHRTLRNPFEKIFTHRSINSEAITNSLLSDAICQIAKEMPSEGVMNAYRWNTVVSGFALEGITSIFRTLGFEAPDLSDEIRKFNEGNYEFLKIKLQKIIDEKLLKSDPEDKFSTLEKEAQMSSLLLLLFAGIETTSLSTKALLYQLMINENYCAKIADEFLSYGLNLVNANIPDFIRKKDTFLHFCYLETLRLTPIIPIIRRVTNKDFNFGDTKIFKGDLIELNIMAAQRNPLVWGDDANEFNPERFKNSPEKALLLNNFSPSPTPCLGKHLAELEIKMMGLFFTRFPFNRELTFDISFDYNSVMLIPHLNTKLTEEQRADIQAQVDIIMGKFKDSDLHEPLISDEISDSEHVAHNISAGISYNDDNEHTPDEP